MIPKKILLCTDFSENSIPARQCAVEFAQAFSADLIILHVINSSQIGYPSLEASVPADIRVALDTIQQSVDKALALMAQETGKILGAVKTDSCIGSPAYEIVRYADENGIGLIVTGTHGWTGFRHLIMGSTAENVVRNANCPVLTVRSSQAEA